MTRKTKTTRAWNKNYEKIKMEWWNPWALCNEWFNYCMVMDFDVIGLTELHIVQNKKRWKCSRWISIEDAEVDEQA